MVHVPYAGVVFCDDILSTGVTPVIWSGPVANWVAAPERLAINLVQLFRERDGLPPPTTAANRLRLFRDVSDLAAVLDR